MKSWREWVAEGYFKTEDMRTGGHVWPAGGAGLYGDPLGPVMHAHDDASELFIFLEGRCRVDVGHLAYEVGAGEVVFIPPGVPHNLINAGDGDMWVFFAVGPNVVGNKWRTDGFAMDGWEGRVELARTDGDGDLPGDARLFARIRTLRGAVERTDPLRDRVYLVLSGAVRARVGQLEGELAERDYIFVPAGIGHRLEARDARVVEIASPPDRS